MSDESKQRRKPGQRLEKTNDRRKRTSSEIVGEARDEWLINDEEEWP